MSKTEEKLIFIILDGLGAEVAHQNMGFLNHLVEKQIAAYYTVKTELPAMSRPLYEVLMTGTIALENKTVSNLCHHQSSMENLFGLAQKAGLKTGASAYHWMSELYNKTPFNDRTDMICLDNSSHLIENGIFYYEDHYPDSHVYSAADFLINQKETDFTLIHSMNIDDAGHKFGSESAEYMEAAIRADALLAKRILEWKKKGINIIITADHGMNSKGYHNGISQAEHYTPLYIISKDILSGNFEDEIIPQLEIAPLACRLLKIKKGEMMVEVKGVHFKEERGADK